MCHKPNPNPNEPHVERVECRVARLIRGSAVAPVCLVSVNLARLTHVVKVLTRVALALC